MNRTIRFELSHVSPVPSSLRAIRDTDAAATRTEINLGQLFLHHYFDSFPCGPPKIDPSRFEYLDYVSAAADFRFHSFVSKASTVRKRSLSTEMGQAFCRLLLHDHFGIVYFAHLNEVIGKATHAAFEGLKLEKCGSGDIPDYLCARRVTSPFIAEAKGRFSSISFGSAEFQKWRTQFSYVRVIDRHGSARKLKGYIIGTRLATEGSRFESCSYIEDPETPGNLPFDEEPSSASLGRVIAASHYARIFSKLGLSSHASALSVGYQLTPQLTFEVPTWECLVQPFQGQKFVGGWYQTAKGSVPTLTDRGWRLPLELGRGHLAFVGLEVNTAARVARAARGSWESLDELPVVRPDGLWSSDLSWLNDGTVAAPASQFIPRGRTQL